MQHENYSLNIDGDEDVEWGRDLRYDLSITLGEAATGASKTVYYPCLCLCDKCQGQGQFKTSPDSWNAAPCSKCSGKGCLKEYKSLEVIFRAGVQNQTSLYYAEYGNAGKHGGKSGGLYVVLNVEADGRSSYTA